MTHMHVSVCVCACVYTKLAHPALEDQSENFCLWVILFSRLIDTEQQERIYWHNLKTSQLI